MEAYKKILKEEVEVFREKGKAFLKGNLSRNDLKGFSGGLGSYAQKEVGKFMIRLRTPSGILSKAHFRLILDYAKDYGLDHIHLTTRQAIQLHELDIDQVCDIMKDGIEHDLFTRGGGGNFPRNVTLSPMAGVDPMEVFDVTPYARQVGDYFFRNATGYKLPRKLKVAFSSSSEDTACATVNDMGFMGALHEGKPMFKLWLAGGLGKDPAVGLLYDKRIKPEEVLYYVEAMIQLFMAEGDYEHKGQARVRYILRRMGTEAFIKCFEKHLAEVQKTHRFEGISPVLEPKENWVSQASHPLMMAQKQKDLYTVELHPLCGQLALEDGEKIFAETADIDGVEYRLTMDQSLYVRNLSKEQAEHLLGEMKGRMMMTPPSMTVTCVGTPTCQTGVNQSQALCRAIHEAVQVSGIDPKSLPRFYISGCPNNCARHSVAEIGFSGRRVKVGDEMAEAFDVYKGGKIGLDETCLAEKQDWILAEDIPGWLVAMAKDGNQK